MKTDNFNYNCADQYKLVLYTNGCSWIENVYLNRAIQHQYPSVLHINRGLSANGNMQIINRSIADLSVLTQLDLPVAAYISFSEVSRNKKELTLVNPSNYSNLNSYFKDILIEQYHLLNSKLKQLNLRYRITTSFVTNCFNDVGSIVDACISPYSQELYALYALEFMKDHNHFFNFNTEDYLVEIDKWNNYFDYLKTSDKIDDTYHPCDVTAYQDCLDFVKTV